MRHTTWRGRRTARRAIERLRVRGNAAALWGGFAAVAGLQEPTERALVTLRYVNRSLPLLYARVER